MKKPKHRWVIQWKNFDGYWSLYKKAKYRSPDTANAMMVKAIFDGFLPPLRVVRRAYKKPNQR